MNAKIRGQKLANRILTQPQSITSPPPRYVLITKGNLVSSRWSYPADTTLTKGSKLNVTSNKTHSHH